MVGPCRTAAEGIPVQTIHNGLGSCDPGRMAQTVCVILSSLVRQMLEAIVADRNRPQKHVDRARVVLASAKRDPVQVVATLLGVSRPMVWRWQRRFAEEGAELLLRDLPRLKDGPCSLLSDPDPATSRVQNRAVLALPTAFPGAHS